MNMDELRALISSELKSEGLDNILPENSINVIAEKVIEKLNFNKNIKDIPEMVSEDLQDNTGTISDDETISQPPTPIAQAEDNNTLEYTPELPDFSKKQEPSQIFVFDMNDLSEGGENMANKPFRTINNPDEKQSMHDFWIKEGKTKAEVYICKFEKLGEINFNFANGTAQFINNNFSEVKDLGMSSNGFAVNPYKSSEENLSLEKDSGNEIDGIENYVKTAVDMEKVVVDTVTKLFNDFIQSKSQSLQPEPSIPTLPIGSPLSETNNLMLKMNLLANDEDNYKKIDLPKELNESIHKSDTKFLKNENEEIFEWEYDSNIYYTPKNRISKTKGYIKL